METQQVENNIEQVPRTRLNQIFGNIETVSVVPSEVPITFEQQVKIYSSGGTFRLYVYDTVGAVWKYTALT